MRPFFPSRIRHGVTLVYASVSMAVIVLAAAWAVDMARIQVVKTQLENAADAAARYAVAGMSSSSTPQTTAQQQALASMNDWLIEGMALDTSALTATVGTFSTQNKTFTASATNPDSVKVDLTFTFSTSNGRPPLFLHVFGGSRQITLHSSAVAQTVSQQTNTFMPPAAGNLWLAGMPPGTLSQNFRADSSVVWDYAGTTATPRQSPLELKLSQLNVSAGDSLSFEGLSGSASYVASSPNNSADGDSTFNVSLGETYPPNVPTNSMNGISNVRAPIGAVMAVFMNDNNPSTTAAPSDLDFSTAAQRDYTSISPSMKQVFFVGDGKWANGEVQHINIPAGATRVFIGMMDAWQWNDNTGDFQFKVYGRKVVRMVK